MSENTEILNDSPAETAAPKKSSAKKRVGIVCGVIAVIVAIAGFGMWTWHDDPAFCGTVCHTPMASYLETYDQKPNTEGVDKYGNPVSNTSAMLAVQHGAMGFDCLTCHKATLGQQISEGTAWLAGNYTYPLDERSVAELGEPTGMGSDEMCLNESCHNMTRDDLYNLTADEENLYNPHWSHHETLDCGTCHKAHGQSVLYCTQCHAQAPVPEGWLSMGEYNEMMDVD